MTTVQVINKSNNELPKYETSGSSGVDVRADFSRVSVENPIKVWGDAEIIFKGDKHEKVLLRLEPGSRALIPTGLFTAIPEGYEIQVRPRSGLALKRGLTVLNTPGTVDSNYTGEVGVILVNLSNEEQIIEPGERIAQLVFAKVEFMELEEIELITKETERGGQGYGDSGRF